MGSQGACSKQAPRARLGHQLAETEPPMRRMHWCLCLRRFIAERRSIAVPVMSWDCRGPFWCRASRLASKAVLQGWPRRRRSCKANAPPFVPVSSAATSHRLLGDECATQHVNDSATRPTLFLYILVSASRLPGPLAGRQIDVQPTKVRTGLHLPVSSLAVPRPALLGSVTRQRTAGKEAAAAPPPTPPPAQLTSEP